MASEIDPDEPARFRAEFLARAGMQDVNAAATAEALVDADGGLRFRPDRGGP